jgi:spore maturation protein CgeB
MRITIIGSKGFDTLEYHLSDSFNFLGHQVKIVDIIDIVPLDYKYNYLLLKYLSNYDDYIFNKIAKLVIESEPDLVIGTYRFISPSCVKKIKKSLPKIPIIHINPDALTSFERQQIFASPYDFYFTKDPYIVDFMVNKMNLNCHFLAEAFNPRVHKKVDINKELIEEKINIDVMAFGSMYPYRYNMIKKIVDAGINVTIFGKQDNRYYMPELKNNFKNEWISGDRKSELLLGSKILFNNFHYAEVNSVNGKFFECAGVGAFQICDYRDSISDFSSIDPEKFTFKNIDEAIDLIKHYLHNPKERADMSNKQYLHFLNNHTYEHRITKILDIIK